MDFLISGSDYLAKNPDFKLIGRDRELERLTAILMRNNANSVLLVGPGGVGCTALVQGLQARKTDPDAPFDIVTKRLFWLDTDALFSPGDSSEVNKNFSNIMKKLKRTSNSIMIIEDTRDFIDAARNSGCSHFVNSLNSSVKNGDTQVILEVRDEDLDYVLKSHSDMRECYTMMDLMEPPSDALVDIITGSSVSLTRHHGIKIDPEAIAVAVEVTNKYRTRDLGLSRAQPERSATLLDRALSSYRLEAHKAHPDAFVLRQMLTSSTNDDHKEEISQKIAALDAQFAVMQAEIRRLSREQRDAESQIVDWEVEIEEIRSQKSKNVNSETVEGVASKIAAFGMNGGFEVPEINALKAKISSAEKILKESREKFNALKDTINSKLILTKELVLLEFSKISGIAANKLSENEREKLRHLEEDILKRIYGQNYAVKRLADAVKTARIGRRNKDKPQAAFMFLGPSGVGKTEIAKALAASLLDDEAALTRFDMSEYMEKHAVAKMIGAPPGYEGFEAGGILTNAMRKNPHRILLFDEIEKAHDDVFNVFLQVLSDGRLTDNVGRTVSFADATLIMTTNIGQTAFLDESLTEEEADALAIQELNNRYRNEFLNRFAGRQNIVCFKRLDLPSIEKIVKREIVNIDSTYSEQGIRVNITEENLVKFCRDHYDPMIGARGLPGYIQTTLEPVIVNTIIENPDYQGTIDVGYDEETKKFVFELK